MAKQIKIKNVKYLDFVELLHEKYGSSNLESEFYRERDILARKYNSMVLFYKNNEHIGTWQDSSAWYFKN